MLLFILIQNILSQCDEIEHCLSCEDPWGYGCDGCEIGYFIDENEYPTSCSPCYPTCKTCYYPEEDYCESCYDGFYLKKGSYGSGSCVLCPQKNCMKCSDSGDHLCSECLPGFILSDNQCVPCHSSCQECSGPEDYQCTKCPSSSFDEITDETHHFCVLCDPNCKKCQDKITCEECNIGFYKNSEGKCSKCDGSCYNCTGGSNTDCIACKEGFYFYGNQCRQCDANCKTCEGVRNVCTSCRDGFYVNSDNVCASCDENCKVCDGPGKCTTCNDGFLVNLNGVCVTCGEKNHCKVCQFVGSSTTKTECLKCADNSYVSQTYYDQTVLCSLCPSNCLTCIDRDFCTSCVSGYFLNRDKCEKCGEGCSSCKDSPTFCTSCVSQYYLDGNSCLKCPEGCIDCESNGSCSSCLNGYYLNQGKCTKCDVSCRTCHDGTSACSECAIGYTFNQFMRCVKCPGNCTICDSTGCLDCDPEFYKLVDGTCAPCSDVCFECTGPTEFDCYECDDGFYFETKLKQCVECDRACSKCYGPREIDCIECATGYWNSTTIDYETYEEIYVCTTCEHGCAKCTDNDICTVCNDGFRLYDGENDPDCEECVVGCKKCDEAKDRCTECLDKYYPVPQENGYVKCSSCPNNCRTCYKDSSSTRVLCKECMDGYYEANGICMRCTAPCATCSSSSVCTSCIAGHLFNGIDSCDVECHSNCFTCDITQTTCTSCHDGFYLLNNTCLKCPFEGCKKCIMGEHTSICRECLDGYILDDYFDTCDKCHESCATCAGISKESCLTCAPGYYVKSSSGARVSCSKCTEADPNCIECHQECQSSDQNCDLLCTRCRDGYSFVNNQCIQCHESCQTCDGPLDTDCITCKDKYFLNSEQKCTQCSESCENCEGTDNKCTSCKPHYYLSNGKCEECSSSCDNCYSTPTNCTSCPKNKFHYAGRCLDSCDEIGKGFGVNTNNECYKCNIYNCLDYDEICQCTKCEEGYYIVTDSITLIEICMPCDINKCNKYDQECHCLQCEYGFYVDKDPETSVDICKSCNVDRCTSYGDSCQCITCENGFKVVTDPTTQKAICSPCDSEGCIEYGEKCGCTKCSNGFSLKKDPSTSVQVCVSCGVEHCISYNESCQCLECDSGFHIDINESTQKEFCSSCFAEHCLHYDDACQCKSCEEGYFVVSDPVTMIEICAEAKQEEILPGQECGGIVKCDFSNDNDDDSDPEDPKPIVIESGAFHDVVDQNDGGAIYLENKVIQMTETVITNCQSKKNGGGIYISLDQPVDKPIVFENVVMKDCRAQAGGAIYAYSDNPENQVNVISCKFENCRAQTQNEGSGNIEYGGSAIYFHVMSGTIAGCSFKKIPGNIVKINKNFGNRLKALAKSGNNNNDEIASLSISSCIFDQSSSSSSPSIFFISGEKHEISVDVKDCTFKGKLSEGAHYIDGVSLSKKKVNSKLRIESCKFSDDSKDAVNAKVLGLASGSFDNDSQQTGYRRFDKNGNQSNLRGAIILSVSCIALIAIIISMIVFVNANRQRESYSA